nr:hypothetical protein [Tanacetum cinerariifolium]
MALALMAKAFKLNYSTPTNNNQRISSNPRNRQIAQLGNLNGYNAIQNVRNQVTQHAVQNPRIQNVVQWNANQNPNENGHLVAARAEGNAARHNGNQIRCYNCRGVGHFAGNYLDEIEEVNENYILMANLQQASTSGTQTDKALVYDSDGSAEYTELLEPILESHQVPQNDNDVISEPDSFYHTEQKMALGYQNPFYLKQAQKKQQSLYDGKVLLEKHDPPVVHDSEETLQLAQESHLKMKQLKKMTLETHNWSSSAHQELHKIIKDENFPIVNQVDARVQDFEIQFLKEAAKFVGDFKSLAKEADESLSKHKALELEIKRLLRAVNALKTVSLKKENEYAKLWNDWYKKCEECKFDKISYDKAYKDMKQKIERLQAQLGDLKGKRIDNIKTRRPQPRSITKTDRVPSASTSSCNKNNGVKVEEHHRNLLLSKNKKHMSFACKNIKLDSQNVISKVVCAMCKQCLISVNHDVCLRNYVNGKTSCGKKQKVNVSIKEKQKKQQSKVKKTKKVAFIERVDTPKPSEPRFFLRWSPTGRLFDLKGKIIASSESESQSDCSNDDNACTSNTLEPKIKRFPNSTPLLGRLSKFVYGVSTRVVLST